MNIFFNRLRRSAERRKTFADLMQLDDHLLRDIGVTRTELIESLRGRGNRIWTHE
ncbi:MAG TPA: DUF1127 domain-containing protein [Devosiaceae bacterium]|jgi:uncharacterized protein YjiS (DUF1127 family)|nr:DUF1127 domain-containing protein [Devosiaceae bacterium]